MIIDYLQLIAGVGLIWGRGYMLIYLVDRSKSFSFGFKFFTGWLAGIAGFTLDVFAFNVFNGFALAPWVFVVAALMQIFGFGFLVLLFERRVPWPDPRRLMPFIKRQLTNLSQWSLLEKAAMLTFLLLLIVRVGMAVWTVSTIPTYEFDAWNSWNLKAKVIYTEQTIPLQENGPFYLGGGITSYPLHDAMFKVWLATAAGEYQDRYVNLASVIYYLFLIAIFYFSLPAKMHRLIKIVATYALSSLPLLVIHSHVAYADLLFSIYLYIAVIALFYYIAGAGNSFFYLSGMGLAFSIWTKNEGLTIIFPLMVVTTLLLLIARRVKLKDFLLGWFFAALTVLPWLGFRVMRRLDIFSGDSSTVDLVLNNQFIGEMWSSIFLRSHFNILWLIVAAVIILRFSDLWKSISLRYLMITLIALFAMYNGVVLFTDKALDLSALARINLQLAPLAVALLAFFFQRFFDTMSTHGQRQT